MFDGGTVVSGGRIATLGLTGADGSLAVYHFLLARALIAAGDDFPISIGSFG
jgi:hypothetical protein